MNEQIRSNGILKIGIGSMLVGLGTFFILEAAFVLIFWFTGVPEAWMTYAGGVCLAGGCFTAGIKMGSGIGKKGIAAGLCAGIILSLLIWVLASIFSGGYV
ncbi:MAG: DUF3792 family protein, partial [Clostridiales bacterium]|nr:DUF3792 family protein [Clostridiales bacterium]